MAKQKGLVSILMWLVGVIVSLAVGFSMTGSGVLNGSIPGLSAIANGVIVSIAGWVVVIATLLGVVMAIIDAVK